MTFAERMAAVRVAGMVSITLRRVHLPSGHDTIVKVHFKDKDAAIRTIGLWSRGDWIYSIVLIKPLERPMWNSTVVSNGQLI